METKAQNLQNQILVTANENRKTEPQKLKQILLILINYLKQCDLEELPEEILKFQEELDLTSFDKKSHFYNLAIEFTILCATINKSIAQRNIEHIAVPVS